MSGGVQAFSPRPGGQFAHPGALPQRPRPLALPRAHQQGAGTGCQLGRDAALGYSEAQGPYIL